MRGGEGMLWGKWSDEDVDEYVILLECFLS